MQKYISKVIISGFISIFICSSLSGIYYNIPLKIVNNDGATDYKWESNKFYSRGTEGFSLGKTNNEGFNNLFDYNGQEIDILLLGSSHMEGFNVAQGKSTASVLNKLLNKGNGVYNIGISGHDIYTQFSNLNDAMKRYSPKNYVVLETMNIPTSNSQLFSVINNNVEPVGTHTSGLIRLLESVDYFKLLATQLKSYINNNAKQAINVDASQKEPIEDFEDNLNMVLEKVKFECEEENVQPIIIYHPSLVLLANGDVETVANNEDMRIFEDLCTKNGIILINMTKRFLKEYEMNSVLPYGFSNTQAGTGHLNENGHRMIAEELYSVIKKEGE